MPSKNIQICIKKVALREDMIRFISWKRLLACYDIKFCRRKLSHFTFKLDICMYMFALYEKYPS